MLIGDLTSLFAFVGSLAVAVSGSQGLELGPKEHNLNQPNLNSFHPSKLDSTTYRGADGRSNRKRNHYQHSDSTGIKFAQLQKRETKINHDTIVNSAKIGATLSSSARPPEGGRQETGSTEDPPEHQSIPIKSNLLLAPVNSNISQNTAKNDTNDDLMKLPAITMTPITTPSEYATVNSDGLIGINATDKFALTTESRSFGVPINSQILMCLLYGTLAFTAIASNMIVCYIVLSDQRMRTATNYFIVNLAVGDILMALLCIPFTFIANLIYQYWPFGLSLCIIVSYAQANTVFISAYTMVAISIDKYLAIIHPMRLRMPKRQAKILILVIWSAALLTSLPTALLSGLVPAALDQFGTTNMTETTTIEPISSSISPYMLGQRQQQEIATSNSSPDGWYQSTSTTIPPISEPILNLDGSKFMDSQQAQHIKHLNNQKQQLQQQEQQRKYFCQETWTFWPRGRYYYSTALMILQYVLPLFVLVITYSRIVIVVWGKRIPGEEDNARDARMARSKRKMIKMVIFCVIAFALTWLPFNALIVIGDMHPDIWENQYIMYIWFITHFLAMCHTITNPLIYVWMNNRFRAGFKQVIWGLYLPIKQLLAYLWYCCCCLGCFFSCSRVKYSRVSSSLRRKHTLNPMIDSANNSSATAATTAVAPHHNHRPQLGAGYAKHSQSRNSLGPAPDGRSGDPRAPNPKQANNNGRPGPEARHPDSSASAGPRLPAKGAQGPSSGAIAVYMDPKPDRSSASEPDIHDQLRQQLLRVEQQQQQPPGHNNEDKLAQASSWTPRGSDRQLEAVGRIVRLPIESISRVFECKRVCAEREEKKKNAQPPPHLRNSASKLQLSSPSPSPASPAAAAAAAEEQDKTFNGFASDEKPWNKKRHRKKQSHGIKIQMTIKEFASTQSTKMGSLDKHARDRPQTAIDGSSTSNGGEKTTKQGNKSGAMRDRARCPACRQKSATCNNNSNSSFAHEDEEAHATGDESHPLSGRARTRGDEFIVDMRQSSQSTATISLLTNTTSLDLSGLDSTWGAHNSTPASLSPASGHNNPERQPSDREQMVAAALEQQEVVVAPSLLPPAEQHDAAPEQQQQQQHQHKPSEMSHHNSNSSQLKLSSVDPGEGRICYTNEIPDSSDNCQRLMSRGPISGDIRLSGAGDEATSLGEEVSSISNYGSPSPSSSDPPSLAAAGGSASDEENIGRYCCEHRNNIMGEQHDAGSRGGQEVNGIDEGNLETDNDVCDIVFNDNRSSSRPGQELASHMVRCSGSLELLSDEFEDEDEDDDDKDDHDHENENGLRDGEEEEEEAEFAMLEAEYGDQGSSLKCSYAMVPLNSFRSADDSSLGPRRRIRLLNRKFRPTGDDLCVYASVRGAQAGKGLKIQQRRQPFNGHRMGLFNSGILAAKFSSQRRSSHELYSAPTSTNGNSSSSSDGGRSSSSGSSSGRSTKDNANGNNISAHRASSEWRFSEPRDRSSRRAMLHNNHLLSSLSRVSKVRTGSSNHFVTGTQTKDCNAACENGDSTRGQGATLSNAPSIARFACLQEKRQPGLLRDKAGDGHLCKGSLTHPPASSNGCNENGSPSRGSSNNRSSSAASASFMEHHAKLSESPISKEQVPVRNRDSNREHQHQHQNQHHQQRPQHHSLTSLSSGRSEALTGFKSLDSAPPLRPQDGTWTGDPICHQLMGPPNGALKERKWQLEKLSHQAKEGDLIDRLGAGDEQRKKLLPSSRKQPIVPDGVDGRHYEETQQQRHHHHQHQQPEQQQLLSWTKSARTLMVRKSPTVYLISKTSRDHGK